MLQYLRYTGDTTKTDEISGTVYFPSAFPNTCRTHVGTPHNNGDLINLRGVTLTSVYFNVYDRIAQSKAANNFDLFAVGY